MRTALVTGMGCVSGCGIGVAPFWAAVREGRPAVGPVRLARDPGRIDRAVQVERDAVLARFGAAQQAACDPCSLFALVAETGEAPDESAFIDAVTTNLRRGRMLIVAAGDGIRTETETLAGLLQSHAAPSQ